MRRSRGARKQAADLCEEVTDAVPELAAEAERLRDVLHAEGLLHELRAESTLEACLLLVRVLEKAEPT